MIAIGDVLHSIDFRPGHRAGAFFCAELTPPFWRQKMIPRKSEAGPPCARGDSNDAELVRVSLNRLLDLLAAEVANRLKQKSAETEHHRTAESQEAGK